MLPCRAIGEQKFLAKGDIDLETLANDCFREGVKIDGL